MKRAATALVAITALSGCATPPENVVATYVSPVTHESYSCKQIVAERNRVVAKVNELTGTQKKAAENDAVAVGVGAIIFWPALFLTASTPDVEAQLASMKGNYEALTAAGAQIGCF